MLDVMMVQLFTFPLLKEAFLFVSMSTELWTLDYCLLGVDLTQLNTVEAALRMCGCDFDTPTLLLSECVMTYMTRRWYVL